MRVQIINAIFSLKFPHLLFLRLLTVERIGTWLLSFSYIPSLASTLQQNHVPSTKAVRPRQRLADTNQSSFSFSWDT